MGAIEQSKALAYVLSKGWAHRVTETEIIVEYCPISSCSNWHFYVNLQSGLWQCHKCGENGNLYQLREHQGDRMEGAMSMKDVANATRQPGELPNVAAAHQRLLSEAEGEALDYLVYERGLSMPVIERLKLGVVDEYGKKWVVIPFFHKENLVYAKYRSLPPAQKEFRGISGREAPLFNQDAIVKDMDELLFVEGELDALACLTYQIENVVGVPGANVKKAVWIKKLDDAAPKRIYLCYDNDKVGQDAAKEMAQRIGLDKCYNIVLPKEVVVKQEVFGEQLDSHVAVKDIGEFFRVGGTVEDFLKLKADAKPFSVDGIYSTAEVIDEIRSDLIKGPLKAKYVTRYPEVNQIIGGFDDGMVIGIMAEGKVGKAQSLSSKVLLSTGWTTMGEVKVGDSLASIDGEPSTVIGVFPRGVKETFRVTFHDGRSTMCSADHLWMAGSVRNFGRDGYKIVDTAQLADLVEHSKGNYHRRSWFIPTFNGKFGVDTELGIDPWLLGVLIGDGGLTNRTPIVTKADQKLIAGVRSVVEPLGYQLNRVAEGDCSYRIVSKVQEWGGYCQNAIMQAMRSLGLAGKLSKDKFIPKAVFSATLPVRIAVLQGLMDTDGSSSCGKKYFNPSYATSSRQLAYDVCELVRSIGGIARITSRIPKFTHNGVKTEGLRAYRVWILHDEPETLFRHSEKMSIPIKRVRQSRLKVTNVERVGAEPVQCIAVSHPSKLYITDDYIVTHNTTWAINLLDALVEDYEKPGLMFCQEMAPKQNVTKWIAYKTDTDHDKITLETVDNALGAIANYKADLLFGFTKDTKYQEVFETIRQAVRRYGVKFVAFDNLQLLCKSFDHSTQEVSVICRGFKNLAMELGIVILLIIQPHRVREGEIIAARNANGSAEIEKIVDTMICLHRNREGKIKQEDFEAAAGFFEAQTNFQPQLLVRADLTRFAGGGATTLWMDGAKSKVTSFPKDIAAMAKSVTLAPQQMVEA